MDFIIGLSRTSKQHDSIMVVVDRLSVVAHFIAVKSTNSASEVAQIFIRNTMRFHGVPNNIISNKYVEFTSKLWKELFVGLGTKLAFNIAYHL